MEIQYFKIKEDRHEYLGERYFKIDWNSDKVVQVCLTTGDIKKGKSNTFGVYLISKQTFVANYLAIGYAVPCAKEEYELMRKKVVKYLS